MNDVCKSVQKDWDKYLEFFLSYFSEKNSKISWKNIKYNSENHMGRCKFCSKYILNGCLMCPVFKITKKKGCAGTPIIELEKIMRSNKKYEFINIEEIKELICLIKKEINFLKSVYI